MTKAERVQAACGRGSGVELDQEVGWIVRFKGDKVIDLHSYLGHS